MVLDKYKAVLANITQKAEYFERLDFANLAAMCREASVSLQEMIDALEALTAAGPVETMEGKDGESV